MVGSHINRLVILYNILAIMSNHSTGYSSFLIKPINFKTLRTLWTF